MTTWVSDYTPVRPSKCIFTIFLEMRIEEVMLIAPDFIEFCRNGISFIHKMMTALEQLESELGGYTRFKKPKHHVFIPYLE